MNKQIITIILGIFLLGGVYALAGGECDTITFPNSDNVSLDITGNSSAVEIDWDKNGTEITYCFPIDMDSDNFTLTWYNYQSVSLDSGSSSSGGGSGRCKTSWVCSNWTRVDECNEERICEKMHSICEPRTEKPEETRKTCYDSNATVSDGNETINGSEDEESPVDVFIFVVICIVVAIIVIVIIFKLF